MLTIKQINEVSFRKSGFSGYKPEDVDDFIDEVSASFTALIKENQMLKSRSNELATKNNEMREKLTVLAEKIESYRDEEDGIKNALLSAQKLGSASIKEAKAKAEAILADANEKAEDMVQEAKKKTTAVVSSYQEKIDIKEREFTAIKSTVTNFRSSLYDIYRNHLNAIENIPDFSKELEAKKCQAAQRVAAPPRPAPVAAVEPAPVAQPEPVPQEEPEAVSDIGEISSDTFSDFDTLLPVADENYAPETVSKESFDEIDFNAYADIPEVLKNDKAALYSSLEFGEDVDVRKNK